MWPFFFRLVLGVGGILASNGSSGEVTALAYQKKSDPRITRKSPKKQVLGFSYSCISWILFFYFTERLVKLARRSAAIFTEKFDDLGRARVTAGAAAGRFSLKAARRFHHVDS